MHFIWPVQLFTLWSSEKTLFVIWIISKAKYYCWLNSSHFYQLYLCIMKQGAVVNSGKKNTRLTFAGSLITAQMSSVWQWRGDLLYMSGEHIIFGGKTHAVQHHCDMANSILYRHNRHPIACPHGQAMGCLLWVKGGLHVGSMS